MLADTRRPYTDTEYLDARDYMTQFAARGARMSSAKWPG
jgi:hypothetical protein